VSIVIENLVKRYPSRKHQGEKIVFSGLDLTVAGEEFVSVLGASGCGKTTLLNCVAGLESFEGSIKIRGRAVREPPQDVAVVFQAPHLLPWRTVAANVRYGLELQRAVPRDQWGDRVDAALDLVGLSSSAKLYPRQLSGGMRQRANIARALAVRPRVLLMDEPFGALDAITKERMQAELQKIAADERLTVVFITHDIAEAIYLGDRGVVMSKPEDAGGGGISAIHPVAEERPRALRFKRSDIAQRLYEELWDEL
jgi:ABC-type nitrate/sulfonate/bicarbonate transport system ATPase subunit